MLIEKLKVIIAITFVISFWSLVTPIFEFPDEQAHIGTVNFLQNVGRVPQGDEWDMTTEMAKTQKYLGVFRDNKGNNLVTYHPEYRVEASNTLIGIYEPAIVELNNQADRSTFVGKEAARYPRLYYDYEGFFYKLTSGADIFVRTYVLRLGNVALAAATALFVYQIGILIFGQSRSALLLSMLVMLQPMYSFLSAGVNSDNLHNLLFTIMIYLALRHLKYQPTLVSSLAMFAALGLDILTKPQGFVALPLMLLSFVPWARTIRLSASHKLLLAIYSLVFLVYAHPYYSPYIGLVTNSPNLHGTTFVEFAKFSLNKLVAQNIVWYWGVFKWLGVVLPPIYYQVANRLILASMLGLIVYLYKVLRQRVVVANPLLVAYLILVTVSYTASIYWFDWNHVKNVGYSLGVQARYLFPTISAQMTLLMVGILSLSWSDKLSLWLRRALVVFVIWMQLGGVWRLLTSYYDLSSLQVFITQVSQYKPDFAKGNWWYLYLSLYLFSLGYLATKVLSNKSRDKVSQK